MANLEAMMMMVLYFGLLWLRQRQLRRSRRARSRRSRRIARRRRIASFHARQIEFEATEDSNLTEIVAKLMTNRLNLSSTMQHRSLWIRPRSHGFTAIISTWDDAQWKRNFCVSKPTFEYLCNAAK